MSDGARITWDDDARRAVEQETIYLRERLRARTETLVREAGRSRVTLADLSQARRRAAHRPAAEPAPVVEPEWPVTFGAYHVLDPAGWIAVCTLASESLAAQVAAREPAGVAIVGRVFTENFGVEKVVANIVANPHLRHLVLCGVESRHRVGETLLALHAAGVDGEGKVIGSPSPIPYVRSLSPDAVRIFRQKMAIADLRGADDPEAVLMHLAGIAPHGAAPPAPWPERWVPPVETVRVTAAGAGMGGRFTPDPAGLFLIGLGPSGRTIHAEHYTREGALDRRVAGETAAAVAGALVQAGLLGDVGHATYVGRELQKAETALRLGLPYEQDRDLDLQAAPAAGAGR